MKFHNIVVVQLVILLSASCSSAATTQSPTPTSAPAFPYTSIPTLLPETTFDPASSVELLSAEYVDVGTGKGCSAIIYLHVRGSPVTGYFRVWNQWYTANDPPMWVIPL